MNFNSWMSDEAIDRAMERHQMSFNHRDKIDAAKTQWEKWELIREWYRIVADDIEASPYYIYGVERYAFGWIERATPIEQLAWHDITLLGIVLYPQYPVGRYFADFANPKLKLVVECDGKQFHDKERDQKRDDELIALGWKVCRIPGSECARVIHLSDILDNSDREDFFESKAQIDIWARDTSTGVLTGIKNIHFEPYEPEYHEDPQSREWLYDYAMNRAIESARSHMSRPSGR